MDVVCMFAAELRWIGQREQVGCWDAGYRWWDGTCVPDITQENTTEPQAVALLRILLLAISASLFWCNRADLSHPVTDSRPKFFSDHPWPQFNIFPEPVSGMIEPSAYFPPSRSLESNAQLLTYMTPNAVSWWLCPVEDHQETYSQWAALFNPWTTVPNSPSLQTSLCSFV